MDDTTIYHDYNVFINIQSDIKKLIKDYYLTNRDEFLRTSLKYQFFFINTFINDKEVMNVSPYSEWIKKDE